VAFNQSLGSQTLAQTVVFFIVASFCSSSIAQQDFWIDTL